MNNIDEKTFCDTLVGMCGCDLRKEASGDYLNDEGLLCCGNCHTPMQKKLVIPIPGLNDRIVRVMCDCEKAVEKRKAQEEQLRNDRRIIESLRNESMIDEKFIDSTFNNFIQREDNSRQLKICRKYVDTFDEMLKKNQGLMFCGNPGTGKSYAAACIANALIDMKVPVTMISFVKLISEIQKNKDGNDEETIVGKLNRVKLLILDDLGAERATDYALERVLNIIDSRYRSKKPMILTTNLSLKQMQQTDDIRYARIYDRVFEMCYPVEFKGPSWRYVEAASRYEKMKKLFE